jgi:hypothetical protein
VAEALDGEKAQQAEHEHVAPTVARDDADRDDHARLGDGRREPGDRRLVHVGADMPEAAAAAIPEHGIEEIAADHQVSPTQLASLPGDALRHITRAGSPEQLSRLLDAASEAVASGLSPTTAVAEERRLMRQSATGQSAAPAAPPAKAQKPPAAAQQPAPLWLRLLRRLRVAVQMLRVTVRGMGTLLRQEGA